MSTRHPELVSCSLCRGRHESDLQCRLDFCAICRCQFPRWDLHIVTQEHIMNCEDYAYTRMKAKEEK